MGKGRQLIQGVPVSRLPVWAIRTQSCRVPERLQMYLRDVTKVVMNSRFLPKLPLVIG